MNNYAILERLANDVATHAIFSSWAIYAIIAFLSILGTVFASYFGARATKSAEIAATKENLDEIKRQLKETTAASKSVEVALSHSDWVRKEENTLKREKLEKLITAAFAIASWSKEEASSALVGNAMDTKAPIDEFDMLSQLYFPELKTQTQEVEKRYRSSMVAAGPIRRYMMEKTHVYQAFTTTREFDKLPVVLAEMDAYAKEHRNTILTGAASVYEAVQHLCAAGFKMMSQLTAVPNISANAD
jgi:hypothetical protein